MAHDLTAELDGKDVLELLAEGPAVAGELLQNRLLRLGPSRHRLDLRLPSAVPVDNDGIVRVNLAAELTRGRFVGRRPFRVRVRNKLLELGEQSRSVGAPRGRQERVEVDRPGEPASDKDCASPAVWDVSPRE